jgi:hypothetical protein
MVAMTGGLFVAVVVFTLAKDGSRLYMRESRIADATLAAVAGFERLRTDIARASFQASPNIRRDPRLCGDPVADPTWPAGLQTLAGLQITPKSPDPSPALAANNLAPDSILIAGNFTGTDHFPMYGVTDIGTNFRVDLQTQIGPLVRQNYPNVDATAQTALLQAAFPAGRALRLVDQSGAVQYGTIAGVTIQNGPAVLLTRNPVLRLRSSDTSFCGLHPLSRGYVNVVNFVQYQVRPLNQTNAPGYAPLYATGQIAPGDAFRTELIRQELNTAGTAIAGTEEIVAEYAVDLKLGITVVQTITNGNADSLLTLAPDNAAVGTWAGSVANAGSLGPQRVRAVRVRLGVRSREADRELNILGGTSGPVAPGLYRFSLAQDGASRFARVRTLQADVALHNQMAVLW